jgi:hypothetical protein
MSTNGLWHPYTDALLRLAAKREAAGLPPAPDVFDDKIWSARRNGKPTTIITTNKPNKVSKP